MKVLQKFSKNCSCHLQSKCLWEKKGRSDTGLELEVGWEVSDVIDLRSEVLSGGKAMWFRRRRKRSGRGRR
jgi:hypothetical protein